VLQAQRMITGSSRQILFERLPPQTQDLHGFFRRWKGAGPVGTVGGFLIANQLMIGTV
jgi:hypothetical protein